MYLALHHHNLAEAILLQEQLNLALYKEKKFSDLEQRKGPFAVINATDMTAGQEVSFTQDFFDWLCVDLNDVEIATGSSGIKRRTINFFTDYAK